MEVERVHRISRRDFNENFVKPRKPVILTGLIDEWPAVGKWSLDWFRQQHGSRMVYRRGTDKSVPLAQHIEEVEQASVERPAPYLRNLNLQTDWPELLPDIQPRISITAPDWMSSPLLPRRWPRKARYLSQFFISGPGTFIPLHFDEWMMHAFITNIIGRKEFSIFPPEDGPLLYPSKAYHPVSSLPDPYHVDEAKYPLVKQARRTSLVLGPGESVLLPAGWWHTTQTLEPCISISSNFVNQHNWTSFRQEMRYARSQQGGSPLMTQGINAYLAVVGSVMALGSALAPSLLDPE